MTLNDLIKAEREARKNLRWFIVNDDVINDNGVTVRVKVKSYDFYNQILMVGDDPINYCSGHTIVTVTNMHKLLRDTINKAGA